MEKSKAIEILQKMHDEKISEAVTRETRVSQLNAEYAAGDHEPDTVAAIKRFTERGIVARAEAEALQDAIDGLFRLEGLDK